jgi:hypothetical protein
MKPKTVIATLGQLLLAPFRQRRKGPDTPPAGREHYEPTPLAASRDKATQLAADVAVAKTPDGGWSDFPPPVLAGCDEPLADGVADLRGVWQVHKGPLKGHVERIEQCGDRVVITAGHVIHDMFADGSLEGGVNDVAAATGAPISVAARFEDGRLNLRPGGGKVVAVTRYLDGDEMIWRYGPWKNRLRRLDPPVIA